MTACPSKIVLGRLETASPGMPLLFPFGDRDDPQRLAVLLAERVAGAFPTSKAIAGKAHVCLDRRTSWKDRLDAASGARTFHFIEALRFLIACCTFDYRFGDHSH